MKHRLYRTEKALERYDQIHSTMHGRMMEAETDGEVYQINLELIRLRKMVGRAFALDTRDRNSMDCADYVTVGPWLRQQVKIAKNEAAQKVP